MKKILWFLLFCVACVTSLWAAGASKVDVEVVAKEQKASFHWYPVQKTFKLVSAKDTAKFAIGLP